MGSSAKLKAIKMAEQQAPQKTVFLDDMSYRQLQVYAISKGIKGNQSRADLEAAIRAA